MNDAAGFEAWYQLEHRRLVNTIALAAGDLNLAQDVTDEAFARCLARWGTSKQPADPTAWTYRVAINDLRSRWRRKHVERSALERLDQHLIAEIPDHSYELWLLVNTLPQRARLAVVLRYIGGLTEAEVAAAMDVAPGTIAATLFQARAQLRTALTERNATDA